MPGFGQIVVGPPGSGKTTYCTGMQQFLRAMGRDVVVFNMDPANERLPYDAAVDISDLVCVEEVARTHGLGPNGSLLYAMEVLEKNAAWLDKRLAEHKGKYVLFDFPGQVELYTHNGCVRNVVRRLAKAGWRLVAVNLVDAHYVADASKFIAVLLMSVTQMLQLELPGVNVLSKVDLVEQYGALPLNLDLEFFTSAGQGDLGRLLRALSDDASMAKHRKLSEALIEVIEDFPFVAYHPLNVEDKECMIRVVRAVDKANGYVYAGVDANRVVYQHTVGRDVEHEPGWALDVQERYVKDGSKD